MAEIAKIELQVMPLSFRFFPHKISPKVKCFKVMRKQQLVCNHCNSLFAVFGRIIKLQ